MLDIIPPDATPLKRCNACLDILPATTEFFHRNEDCLYDVANICKQCKKAGKHAVKPLPLPSGWKRCSACDTVLPATTEYFQRHSQNVLRSQCRECQAKYRNSSHGKEVHAKDHRLYYQRHREEAIEKVQLYRDLNREVINEKQRQAYALNKVQNQPRYRAYYQKRRAREKNVAGTLTPQEVRDKLKAQNYACYYCFIKFEKRKNGVYIYELDHTIPVSRPECKPRHDVNFVVLACHRCNQSKKDRLPHEWPQGGRLL